MKTIRPGSIAAVALAAVVSLAPSLALAISMSLDPLSASLPGIPATSGDILSPSTAPPAAPLPGVSLSTAALGLLPGDTIDAFSFFDDPVPGGPGVTSFFSVSRGAMGPGVVAPPDVSGESAAFVPAFTQGEASGDLFETNDGVCIPFGVHTQALDGNGGLIGPGSVCGYGGGVPFGLGLTELLPTPIVTFNDDMDGFDLGAAGRGRIFCILLSLAPGSPTLTPGANPLLPTGAEPGDILVACPGTAPATASSPGLFMGFPATALGIVSGGPGCVPPACDDIDAIGGGPTFSLSPGSASVVGPPFASAAAIIGVGPVVVVSPAMLGLVPGDDIDALESAAQLCPVFPGADPPDGDGVGGCDNCPAVFNPGQEDTDGDLIGDDCDLCTDIDVDGFGNMDFPANGCAVDLCPFSPGPNVDTDGDGWADECDNCPLVANTSQTDTDFDGIGDPCDPCPHIFLGVPAALTTAKMAGLGYKTTGLGGGDDSVKTGGSFTTVTAFDPDSTDNVHVTLTNTGSGATLASQAMTFGSGFWTQPNPAKLAWKYADTGPPGVKASIKEAPTASTIYKFKLGVKSTNLVGPVLALTDDIRVTLEITPANLCFDATLATCVNKPTKDQCKP